MKMNSVEAWHNFAVRQLVAAFQKCEAKGVPPEITVQTALSSALTMLIAAQGPDEAASLLESMAATIRRGEITGTEH
jgi:hypothetical protein